MKFLIAFCLVVVAMATAEPPRPRPVLLSRQTQPPYQPRGWRPTGPAFNLPLRSQNQQAGNNVPTPVPSYGPPASYGPPPDFPQDNTTEYPGTTEFNTESNQFLVEAENIELDPRDSKAKTKKTGKDEDNKEKEAKASVLLFLPQKQNLFLQQKQNLFYAPVSQVATPQVAAPLVAIPGEKFAKLQAVPLPGALQVVPYSAAVTSSVFTPYSASFVQFYQ